MNDTYMQNSGMLIHICENWTSEMLQSAGPQKIESHEKFLIV